MTQRTSPLDYVTVAAPCSAGWDNMVGDERVRFCGQCQLNVYNLSAMTKQDAERLVAQTEGRLCIRFYRRADGTILTRNCPRGVRALKRRLTRTATACASAVISFCAGILAVTGLRPSPEPSVAAPPILIKADEELPEPTLIMGEYEAPVYTKGEMIIGDIAPVAGQMKILEEPTEHHVRERPQRLGRKRK
jgi:hypothetical protein